MRMEFVNERTHSEEEEEEEVIDIVRQCQNGSYLRDQADLAVRCAAKKMAADCAAASSVEQQKDWSKGGQKNPAVPYLEDDTPTTPQPEVLHAVERKNNHCNPSDDVLKMVVGIIPSSDDISQKQQPLRSTPGRHDPTPTTTTLDRSDQLRLPGAFMGGAGDVLRRAEVIPFSLVGAASDDSDEGTDVESPPASSSDEVPVVLPGRTSGSDPVANLVTEEQDEMNREDLPRAESIRLGLGSSTKTIVLPCGGGRCTTIVLLALAFLAATLLLLSIFVFPTSQGGQGEKESTIAPTPAPMLLSPKEYVFQLLPQYTQQEIQRAEDDDDSPHQQTPQTMAYNWILQDPHLMEYPEASIVQRYALATIYYALDGDNWVQNDNWLSYDHHECDWFSKNQHLFAEQNPIAKNFPINKHMENWTFPCGEDWKKGTNGTALSQRYHPYTQLWLFTNNLQGQIPLETYLLTGLQGLILKINPGLKGSTISTHIGKLTSLEILSLGVSNIEGTIPTEIGLLTNMHTLFTAKNKLKGTLPSELGLLSKMAAMVTDECHHTGTIPTELGGIRSVRNMRIQNNELTGWIPSELGLLTALEDLSLHGNKLSGWLPSELEALPKQQNNNGSLIALHLEGNSFSGTVPDQLCDIGTNVTCPFHPAFPCGLSFDCSEALCGCACPCAH